MIHKKLKDTDIPNELAEIAEKIQHIKRSSPVIYQIILPNGWLVKIENPLKEELEKYKKENGKITTVNNDDLIEELKIKGKKLIDNL